MVSLDSGFASFFYLGDELRGQELVVFGVVQMQVLGSVGARQHALGLLVCAVNFPDDVGDQLHIQRDIVVHKSWVLDLGRSWSLGLTVCKCTSFEVLLKVRRRGCPVLRDRVKGSVSGHVAVLRDSPRGVLHKCGHGLTGG